MIHGTDLRMSSGVSSRFALYAGYISVRKVSPGASNTTAMCEGRSLRRTSRRAVVNPNTALVLNPFEFTLGFLMKA